MKNRKNNKGFSLVELIVVVAIMAVLVGVLAPAYLRYVEKSRIQKDESAVAEVIQAVKVACTEETVASKLPVSNTAYTVVVKNGSISGQTDVVNEVLKTTPQASVKLTSNAHKGQQYTINIMSTADGISVADYDATTGWADVPANAG